MSKRIKAMTSLRRYMACGHDHTNVTLWGLKDGRILKRRVDISHRDENHIADRVGSHSKWAQVDGIASFNISGRIDHRDKIVTVGGGGCHNSRQVAYAIKRLERQYPNYDILVEGTTMGLWEAINKC